MNIQKARHWLDLLKQASILHPNPECKLMDVQTSCNTPGCVAGWTYQIMKDYTIFNSISANDYEYDIVARRLMEYFELGKKEGIGKWSTLAYLTELWATCFNIPYGAFPFSCASAYTLKIEPDRTNVPLSLIVQKWEEFIQFMEKKNEANITTQE